MQRRFVLSKIYQDDTRHTDNYVSYKNRSQPASTQQIHLIQMSTRDQASDPPNEWSSSLIPNEHDVFYRLSERNHRTAPISTCGWFAIGSTLTKPHTQYDSVTEEKVRSQVMMQERHPEMQLVIKTPTQNATQIMYHSTMPIV